MADGGEEVLQRLRDILGEEHLLTGAALAPWEEDWRGRYRGKALGLALPGDTAQVAAVVRCCAAARVPLVPQGGNTGLVGGATPDASGASLILGLRRLNRIRSVDAANSTLVAEAGCPLAQVQAAAQAAGRLFPLSLASEGSCTLGGNLSTNAGGVQVLRYGNTRELTLGLEVVLPDGQVWAGLRGLRKDNTGYDLKQLFIGAEGTLGIITAASLRLFPLPQGVVTAWLGVADPDAAVALLTAAQARFGAGLTAFELISDASLDLVLKWMPGSRNPISRQSWYVLMEVSHGGSEAELREALTEWLGALLGSADGGLVRDGALAESLREAGEFWALRENISESQKREGVSIKHDVSLPVSAIPAFLIAAAAALEEVFAGVRVIAFGHLGDGNLHYNLSKPDQAENQAFLASQARVNTLVHDLVAAANGSISAEHGIGQLKREELRRYKSPLELELMARVKTALDPLGIMNPGKVL